MSNWRHPGIAAALVAAVLFGAGTPFAKLLLDSTNPWILAGLLYLGSGVGLMLVRAVRRARRADIATEDIKWLVAAVLSGGMLAPVFLMWGLAGSSASSASLLLNAEGVFTALIAWFVVRENFDRRVAIGMVCIVAGAIVLACPGGATLGADEPPGLPALAILGACLAWALDNNFTRKIALSDATFIAMIKGVTAGATNIAIALTLGAQIPTLNISLAAALLGFLSYGISLVLFVIALRHVGTARSAAYFSIAPFVGALIAVVLGDVITVPLILAGLLMGVGVWLHVTEQHVHQHSHEPLEHTHVHAHDEHHQHMHEFPVEPGVRHSHSHRHEALTHSHAHFPDAHHTHRH